jgi:hypothetical protein
MFRATILPIFRSTRLRDTACGIKHPVCCCPVVLESEKLRFQTTDRQHSGYIIPQAVSRSLVLQKMGRMVARNM